MPRKLPSLRLLSKAEASRLGLSHKARPAVNAEVKRPTKRSKIFTYRQYRKAATGRSPEAFAVERKRLAGLLPSFTKAEISDLARLQPSGKRYQKPISSIVAKIGDDKDALDEFFVALGSPPTVQASSVTHTKESIMRRHDREVRKGAYRRAL